MFGIEFILLTIIGVIITAMLIIISEYMQNNTADSKLIFRRNIDNVKLRVSGMKFDS